MNPKLYDKLFMAKTGKGGGLLCLRPSLRNGDRGPIAAMDLGHSEMIDRSGFDTARRLRCAKRYGQIGEMKKTDIR